MNNVEHKRELEYDIWQPSEIKGAPDLNVKVRLLPITERAQQRVDEYGDYDPPSAAEFAQDEADEERIQLYLSVLLPRAKEFMLMLADQKQPAYKDAYNAEELVGELAAAAGQPIDLLEEILRALGEDPEEILYNASTEGEY